jgi:hypothetical protein
MKRVMLVSRKQAESVTGTSDVLTLLNQSACGRFRP